VSVFLSPRWPAVTRRRVGVVGRSVAAALRAAPPQPRDAGPVALAKLYARLLDEADELHAAAVAVLAGLDRDDVHGRAHVQKLADALDARQAAADIGPKLLAALQALNLTPAARGRDSKGVPARDPAADQLAALRAAKRRRGTGEPAPPDLHTTAP
jgi:hypothetical protein